MTTTRAGGKWAWAVLAIACTRPGSKAAEPPASGPAAPAVTCPSGTELRGAAPPAGDRAWCEREGGTLHGPVAEWFGDGQRRLVGEYRDGSKHGSWSSWYDGGKPRSEEQWSAGAPTGTWVTYFADGGRSTLSRHGEGGAIAFQSFRPGGAKLRQGTYRDRREQGTWTEWDAAGTAITSQWKDGVRIGGARALLGIPECDAYIAGYARCIDEHVPESIRPGMREALDVAAEAWRGALANPATRGALPDVCKAANQAARTVTEPMGCSW